MAFHGFFFVCSDCVVDVLNRIMFTCHAQRSCSFNVTDEFLHISSSPCSSDVQKHLSLVHMCGKNLEIFIFCYYLNIFWTFIFQLTKRFLAPSQSLDLRVAPNR